MELETNKVRANLEPNACKAISQNLKARKKAHSGQNGLECDAQDWLLFVSDFHKIYNQVKRIIIFPADLLIIYNSCFPPAKQRAVTDLKHNFHLGIVKKHGF